MKKALVFFALMLPVFLWAQTQVSGIVTDASDAPLPGVSVSVKGTRTGTTTGADGRYSISVPANATLVFSIVGYTNQ